MFRPVCERQKKIKQNSGKKYKTLIRVIQEEGEGEAEEAEEEKKKEEEGDKENKNKK
jgi:hypothetical protein